MAATGKTVNEIMHDHWQEYGRHFYLRTDFENVEIEKANKLIENLAQSLPSLKGKEYGDYTIGEAIQYTYHDPVDGSISKNQGIVIEFTNGSRIVCRLSGTGTQGATVRMYIEKYEPDSKKHNQESAEALKELFAIAYELTCVKEFTGMDKPTVIT